jgi:hypothetical protein
VGERNTALNRAAYSLGQLVGASALDAATVALSLATTALTVGLTRREAELTIASGLRAGMTQPRSLCHG